MSAVTQPTTFQDHLKTLGEILENLKKIGVQNADQKGQKFHSFEVSQFNSEQDRVNNVLGAMKLTYDQFSKLQNPTNILKHVNERLILNNFKQPIHDCLQNLKKRMRQQANNMSLHSTIQRLESLCVEEGLSFDKDKDIFISCDMFCIEITLDNNGMVEDVKVHYTHTGELKPLKELVNILRKKDFKEFQMHLKGLKQRYLLLKGDTSIKSKALLALDVLEKDITKIMNSDASFSNIGNSITKGPVGYVTQTVGGRNLALTYFADPLELIDVNSPGKNKQFLEDGLPRGFGFSVVVSVESSQENILPTVSTVSLEGVALQFSQLDASNSELLGANFVLQFEEPLPISITTAKLLQKVTNLDTPFFHESVAKLDDLIIEQTYGLTRETWSEEEFFIQLPGDMYHEFRCLPSDKDNIGLMIYKIPFNQAAQLPHIMKILRCQAIYNTLLCSCLKKSMKTITKPDTTPLVFDVKAFEDNQLTINFIHPMDDSLGSIDFVVSSSNSEVECSLNVLPGSPIVCTNDYLSKVTNRCFSIPLVMRCLMNKVKTYIPGMVTTADKPTSPHKAFQKPLKLVMPTIAQIQANNSLISPQLTNSPSSFLNFGLTGIPGASLFSTEHSNVGKQKQSSAESTPDGSQTPSKLKLPKITLKRKRTDASDIYEIDKTKSEIVGGDRQTTLVTTTKPSTMQERIESLSFAFPPSLTSQMSLQRSDSVFSDGVTFPELAGIPLDSDADLDNFLGIPHEPFMQTDASMSLGGNAQPAAFAIDPIGPGNEMNFDTLPGNAIDPSSLVTTSTSFDIDPSIMMDIDSLM